MGLDFRASGFPGFRKWKHYCRSGSELVVVVVVLVVVVVVVVVVEVLAP